MSYDPNTAALLQQLATVEADRDLARDIAVALEQENAEMDAAAVRAISAEAKAVRELEQENARLADEVRRLTAGARAALEVLRISEDDKGGQILTALLAGDI